MYNTALECLKNQQVTRLPKCEATFLLISSLKFQNLSSYLLILFVSFFFSDVTEKLICCHSLHKSLIRDAFEWLSFTRCRWCTVQCAMKKVQLGDVFGTLNHKNQSGHFKDVIKQSGLVFGQPCRQTSGPPCRGTVITRAKWNYLVETISTNNSPCKHSCQRSGLRKKYCCFRKHGQKIGSVGRFILFFSDNGAKVR